MPFCTLLVASLAVLQCCSFPIAACKFKSCGLAVCFAGQAATVLQSVLRAVRLKALVDLLASFPNGFEVHCCAHC